MTFFFPLQEKDIKHWQLSLISPPAVQEPSKYDKEHGRNNRNELNTSHLCPYSTQKKSHQKLKHSSQMWSETFK